MSKHQLNNLLININNITINDANILKELLVYELRLYFTHN